MIPWPPPLRAPPDLQCDIRIEQFEAELPQVEVVAVVRGSNTEQVPTADEFRLHHQRGPIAKLHPSPGIGLVLDTIHIIFAAPILTKPDGLTATDGGGIEFSRDAGSRTEHAGFISGPRMNDSETDKFGTKLCPQSFQQRLRDGFAPVDFHLPDSNAHNDTSHVLCDLLAAVGLRAEKGSIDQIQGH